MIFLADPKPFACLKEGLKQTLCSLLTLDLLDIASNSFFNQLLLLLVPQQLTQGYGDSHLKNTLESRPKTC